MGAISFSRKWPSKSIISNNLAAMKKESLSWLVEPVGYQIDLVIEYRVFTVNAPWEKKLFNLQNHVRVCPMC